MGSMASFYPITGIQEGLDPNKEELLRKVPVRMEVDDWYQSQDVIHINQRALFFPAFLKLQRMDPKEKLSWYQLAGIHGKPFVAWDEPPQKGITDNRGYCTHNSMLFATWHRPYMALWEQVIFELMKKEIESYDKQERDGLLEAAQSWRWPYWDWARKKPLPEDNKRINYNVPLVMLKQKVTIRLPAPQNKGEIENAFYEFRMPGNISMGDASLGNDSNPYTDLRITPLKGQDEVENGKYADYAVPWDQCRATSRHPKMPPKGEVNIDFENGKQDNDEVAKMIRDYPDGKGDEKEKEELRKGNNTASLRDAFYRITTIERFEDFATKRFPGKGPGPNNTKDYAFDSCESLHDNLHGWCGGDSTAINEKGIKYMGHMSHVPLAAYDPIFWLHHCNVDRVIAIWQLIHETEWFNKLEDVRYEDPGTFAIEVRHKDEPADKLRPFRKDHEGNYWTSTDAKEPTQMGYTYPGLEKWKCTKSDGSYDKEAHLNTLIESLNRDYNSAKAAAIKARITKDPNDVTGMSLMSLQPLMEKAQWKPEDIQVDDYVINVVYEKFALGGTSFSVHIFVGQVPDELPYTFREPGTQVGEVINFSTEADSIGRSPEEGCPNCRSQQAEEALSTGRVILTNALITRFKQQIDHEPRDPAGPRVLQSMTPKDVVKFLKYNLHWRVTSLGRDVPASEYGRWLTVSVAVGKAEHYADPGKQSKFHAYKGAFQATEGRPGGAFLPVASPAGAGFDDFVMLYRPGDHVEFDYDE